MAIQTSGSDRVTAVANRLRLAQIDFADAEETVRKEYLSEEIQRALAEIVPGERPQFLDELSKRFPTWEGVSDLQPREVRGQFSEKEVNDAGFLVTRLIGVYKTLPENAQRAVVAKLKEVGIVAETAAPQWPADVLGEFRKRLQMTPQETVDPRRVLEVVLVLTEFLLSIETAVWTAWRTLAPANTPIKKPVNTQKDIRRYLGGDQTIPIGQVQQDVGKDREIIAALITAIPQAGRFAAQFFNSISPDEIKLLVGGGVFGADQKCWRKYVELAGTKDVAAITDEIQRAIATFVEGLIRH